MKLPSVFFILVVGAVALPRKRDVVKEIDKGVEDIPFMALVHMRAESLNFQEWAIILTEKWLLSSFNYSQLKTFNITVELYTHLLNGNVHEFEIAKVIERVPKENELMIYPPFVLIKLKHPINFSDSLKPILIAAPNYKFKEGEAAKIFQLNSVIPGDLSNPLDYFDTSKKVMSDDKIYSSELNTCLNSSETNLVEHLISDPVILDGKLVGVSLRMNCKNPVFLRISFIYDWIMKYVPELRNRRTISRGRSKFHISYKKNFLTVFLSELFGHNQTRIADKMYISNITINIHNNGGVSDSLRFP